MAVISKLDYDRCIVQPAVSCSTLIHPWTPSCRVAVLRVVYALLKGGAQFFMPVYLLQIILKGKNINAKFLKETIFQSYPRSVLYAVIYGTTFFMTNCLLRSWTGAFKFYNIGFLPGIIGAAAIFVESNRYKYLNAVLYFNLAVESFVRLLHNENIIRRTPARETLLFMVCSAILMYIKAAEDKPSKICNLWFYTPCNINRTHSEIKDQSCSKESDVIPFNKCSHIKVCKNCIDYALQGTYNYARLGFIVQVVKSVLGKFNRIVTNPSILKDVIFSKKNIRFGLVLGGYAAIYRLMCCYLRKKYGSEKRIHCLLAGFCAGGTYVISPNIGFAIMAFTTILQLQIEKLREKGHVRNQLLLSQLVFILCSGVLFHFRFLHRESCPSTVPNMLKTFTSGLLDKIYDHVLGFLPARCRIVV